MALVEFGFRRQILQALTASVSGLGSPTPTVVEVQGGGGVDPWMDENWSSYANIAALTGDSDWRFVESGQLSFDTGVVISGVNTKSLKMSFPSGEGDDYQITAAMELLTTRTEIWTEIIDRFSSSFTVLGQVGSSANEDYKKDFWGIDQDGVRFEWKHTGESPELVGGEGTGPNHPTGHLEIPSGIEPVSEQDDPPNGYIYDDLDYVSRAHIKIGSGSDGVFEVWFGPYGGTITRVINKTGINWNGNYGSMDEFEIGGNMNRGTSRAMSRWIHRVRHWNTNPGW